ncbi:MAG: hypothetical protein ABSD20_08260, partial [Terriglobales bacterium]
MKTKLRQILFIAILLGLLRMVAMALGAPELALDGGKVYPSATAAPINNAVVLIRNGQIVAVGTRDNVKVSKSAKV